MADESQMNICDVLRRWRRAEDMTLDDASRVIGLPRHTLNRVELGGMPDGETLAKLLTWLVSKPARRPRK